MESAVIGKGFHVSLLPKFGLLYSLQISKFSIRKLSSYSRSSGKIAISLFPRKFIAVGRRAIKCTAPSGEQKHVSYLGNNFGSSKSFSISTTTKRKHSYRVTFFGNDGFSLPSLVCLKEILEPNNLAVVTSSLKNAVGKYSVANGLPATIWEEYKTLVNKEDADIGVVASFGQLIPSKVIQRFPMGIINVHASLLPRWRGAAPIPWSILTGDLETGISIMKIAPKRFDVGPVLYQEKVPIDENIRLPELTKVLSHLGASCILKVFSDLEHYLSNPVFQDESQAKLSPKLSPEMAFVDWENSSSTQVFNLFRALYGTYTIKSFFQGRRVDLDEIGVVKDKSKNCTFHPKACESDCNNVLEVDADVIQSKLSSNVSPGYVMLYDDVLLVKCSCNLSRETTLLSWVFVKKVKIGQKWMTAKDFHNGYLSKKTSEQRYLRVRV